MKTRHLSFVWMVGFCLAFLSPYPARGQQPNFIARTFEFPWTQVAGLEGICLPIVLADGQSHLFIVDTSTNDCSIDSSLAKSISPSIQTKVFDKDTKVDYIDTTADLGHSYPQIPDLPLILIDMSAIRSVYPDIHGIIGLNFLEFFAVGLDFTNRKLEIILPGKVAGTVNEPKGAYRIPLLKKEDKYYVKGTLDGKPITFAIDTGSMETTVQEPALLSSLHPQGVLSGFTNVVGNEHGPSPEAANERLFRFHKLAIGSLVWTDPIISNNTPAQAGETITQINSLGMSFLHRFRILLDFPDHLMYAWPDPGFHQSQQEWISTGVSVGQATDKTVVVTRVLTPSPAAAAGIQVGDEIIEVNGKAASKMTAEEFQANVPHKEGDELTLVIRREGDPKLHTFKLKAKKLL